MTSDNIGVLLGGERGSEHGDGRAVFHHDEIASLPLLTSMTRPRDLLWALTGHLL
jgi:hypothetical protein